MGDPASRLHHHLEALDDCYAELLALTPHAERLVARPELAEESHQRYERQGFARLSGVISEPALVALAQELWPVLSPLAFDVAMRHQPQPGGTLSAGHHFRRVDPSSLQPGPVRDGLTSVLEAVGVVGFFRAMADKLAPLICYIVGAAEYDRVFFNLYDEGDYISFHDDAHMGDRIDINLSTTLDGVGGIRVLSDGFFKMYYDPAISILAPRVWHEVPPLLSTVPSCPPRRLTMTMRYGLTPFPVR